MAGLQDIGPAERRRLAILLVLRLLATVTVIVTLYYVLPYDHISTTGSVVAVIAGLLGLSLVLFMDFKAVVRAPHPGLRAVEALAMIVSTFLILFASLYYLLDRADPGSFSQHMARTDALYFTLTTFATVGYGDITAVTGGARVAVMFQMVFDLLLIGFGVRALFQAVQIGQERRSSREEAQAGSSSGRH